MIISEKEYKEMCKKLNIKPAQKTSHNSEFDSLAEQNFYYFYLVDRIKSGEIIDCQLHSSFKLLDAIPQYKLREKVFKPDFTITLKNGDVFVIEMKGSKVKKLQRDYGLRKHLFIEKYCIPNQWTFIELKSENWTQQPIIEKQKEIFKKVK